MFKAQAYNAGMTFLGSFLTHEGTKAANSLAVFASTESPIAPNTVAIFSQCLYECPHTYVQEFNKVLLSFGDTTPLMNSLLSVNCAEFTDLMDLTRLLPNRSMIKVKEAAMKAMQQGVDLVIGRNEQGSDDSLLSPLQFMAERYVLQTKSISPTKPIVFSVIGERLFLGTEVPLGNITALINPATDPSEQMRGFIKQLLSGSLDGQLLSMDSDSLKKITKGYLEKYRALLDDMNDQKAARVAMMFEYLQDHDGIRPRDYMQLAGIVSSTATRDLQELVKLGVLEKGKKDGEKSLHRLVKQED